MTPWSCLGGSVVIAEGVTSCFGGSDAGVAAGGRSTTV